jgi:hypothetical protein
MENVIMKEIRSIRKKLDQEYRRNPEAVRNRLNKIEQENKHRLVKFAPKYLKKSAA